MLKLLKMSENDFVVFYEKEIRKVSSLDKLISLLRGIEIDLVEIEESLLDLARTGNDTAHFGIKGLFMFSNREF